MVVVQDAYFLPEDIATGLITGSYRRVGSVVRHATGPNKGQIVKHLQPVDINATEQKPGIGERVLQFAQQHKMGIGITASIATATGIGLFCFDKWKNRETEELIAFRSALKVYIGAIRSGSLHVNMINDLRKTLEALKKHKDYEKITLQLTAEDLEVLVERIYDYTLKLAVDNSMEIPIKRIGQSNSALNNLDYYLEEQERIFKIAG